MEKGSENSSQWALWRRLKNLLRGVVGITLLLPIFVLVLIKAVCDEWTARH